MQIKGQGLLISLPASEVGGFRPSGSIYALEELRKLRVSDDLRAALGAAEQHCKKGKLTLRLVARPEIFTHGAALQWLHEHTRGIEDHLCISDGTAVRPIPQMRNHLFLYRPGSAEHAGAFRRLTGWLPELLVSMHTQVNTCFSVRVDRRPVALPLVLLQAGQLRRDRATYHRYRSGEAIDDAVEQALQSQTTLGGRQPSLTHAVYVPLTQIAAQSLAFARVLATLVRRAREDARLAVVIGLPRLRTTSTLKERMVLAAQTLRLGGFKPARGASERLVFATQDPGLGSFNGLASFDMLAHESFSFWWHPRTYYERFQKIQIISAGRSKPEQQALAHMLTTAFGRTPELVNLTVAS